MRSTEQDISDESAGGGGIKYARVGERKKAVLHFVHVACFATKTSKGEMGDDSFVESKQKERGEGGNGNRIVYDNGGMGKRGNEENPSRRRGCQETTQHLPLSSQPSPS